MRDQKIVFYLYGKTRTNAENLIPQIGFEQGTQEHQPKTMVDSVSQNSCPIGLCIQETR
jgi:hypothetical protein